MLRRNETAKDNLTSGNADMLFLSQEKLGMTEPLLGTGDDYSASACFFSKFKILWLVPTIAEHWDVGKTRGGRSREANFTY